MFALVDCNNFYVSCERVFHPGLNGKPVVVLSNNDGCIISRSEEAKALDLKMAEPVFQRAALVKEKGVCLFSSNYTLYGDLSQRVMDNLRQEAPNIEVYSIDEAFLDLTGVEVDYEAWAWHVKKIVFRNTGIPVSIGIASTKTLAKIASKAAKLTNGVFVVKNSHHRDCLTRNTAIEKVWGIGRQYTGLLYKNRIYTAFDFSELDDTWLREKMKVMGLRIKAELRGEPCIPLEIGAPIKKAIATTRAFGKKIDSKVLVREAVATYAARCAAKLRQQGSAANLLTVFVHTDPFNHNGMLYNKSKTITLPVSTNSTMELIKFSLLVLEKIFVKGYLYKKAGVIVEGLEPQESCQGDLFGYLGREKQKSLGQAIDRINRYFGRDKVKAAIQGSGSEWKLRQEKLSNRYTTNWDEILEVKV